MTSSRSRSPQQKHQRPGTLFLLVGPSRVGKDSILKALLRTPSLKLRKLVTVTTRERRPREVPGRTYHYVSEDEFIRRQQQHAFLEWAPVRNHRFGTPCEPLLTWLNAGQDVVQQVDVRGADALRTHGDLHVVTIFILPGSVDDLKRRLDQPAFTPEQRRIRWQEALHELQKQTEYDYRVVNTVGKLDQAVAEVVGIIRAVRGEQRRTSTRHRS